MLVRKTVTVVFCDVTESTRLGETLDPETHRRVMSRYFDEMSGALEAHGGTVEKFIGDAVMAVFGVPTVHEDDALRAVRAASEMRERLVRLNKELEPAYGLTLEMRIGVNTGEVVAGDSASGHTLVTGDAVVVAKRLEEAAPPGQILIGKATYPLVSHAVQAGPLQSFKAKGKDAGLPSRSVEDVSIGAGGIARRLDALLVGRDDELAALREELDRVRHGRTCRLVTLLGPAGIGKSRLARELLAAAAGDATTLTGRCLPYGDGITYWPLVELVSDAGGEEAVRARLAGVEQGQLAVDRVLAATGAGDPSASTEETFWGVRRFLETLAEERPLVICLEDMHWAEPTLLDLVDYLAGWIHEAPVLLLCLARPELLERRPDWSAPRENAVIVTLEPLSDTASSKLLAGMSEGTALQETTQIRIAEAAEGNPLFLEQLTAMAAETGNGAPLRVPPSVQAVIAERLDRLAADERAVVECAAIVGKEFVRGAVIELAGPEAGATVGRALRELVRKGLVRPHVSAMVGDDGFRFGHVLIRDVAYDAMPKQLRAELHERFPDWIERNAGERAGELEEIIAYHLEQARRYRTELGPTDERTVALAQRAATLLGRAGRRAFARGDMPAAVALLSRADALLGDEDERRLDLVIVLARALIQSGDLARAETLLAGASETAGAAGNRRIGALASIEQAYVHLYTDMHNGAEEAERTADEALATFEELSDRHGQARALNLLAAVHWHRCRYGPMEEVLERALSQAEAEDRRLLVGIRSGLARAAVLGPRPVGEAQDVCSQILVDAAGDASLEAVVNAMLAALSAMQGRFDEARTLYMSSQRLFEELGMRLQLAGLRTYSGLVELLAGDAHAAENETVRGYEELERMGELGQLSTIAALRAHALLLQDRHEEADAFVRTSLEAASDDDLVSQVFARSARGRILAAQGRLAEAEEVTRDAVRLAEQTDSPFLRAVAAADLAEVLRAAGAGTAAQSEAERALALSEAKGDEVSSERARRFLRDAEARLTWAPASGSTSRSDRREERHG